jgi:hypothetical protein
VALNWARVARSTRTASFAVLAALCCTPSAYADATSVDGADAPIVRISVRAGDVIVRTWDRPTVQVDGGDATLTVERRTTSQAGGERSILIPEAEAKTAQGTATLPAESFVSAYIPPGDRALINVHETALDNTAPITVTIPADSVFVFAHASNGTLEVHDYRAGTFVGFASRGRLSLIDVGGTVFAQTGLGPLLVHGSNFDRIRARSLRGNVIFEHCSARQIETTAVDGSIVYDAGTFGAGLARFESTSGNVAVGTTSAANLGGRTMGGGGRVYTDFSSDSAVDARDGQADAVVKGGGPVVTATSEIGNVYLYDGSLRERESLPPEWSAPEQTLQRPGGRPRAHFAHVPRHVAPPLRYRVPSL